MMALYFKEQERRKEHRQSLCRGASAHAKDVKTSRPPPPIAVHEGVNGDNFRITVAGRVVDGLIPATIEGCRKVWMLAE